MRNQQKTGQLFVFSTFSFYAKSLRVTFEWHYPPKMRLFPAENSATFLKTWQNVFVPAKKSGKKFCHFFEQAEKWQNLLPLFCRDKKWQGILPLFHLISKMARNFATFSKKQKSGKISFHILAGTKKVARIFATFSLEHKSGKKFCHFFTLLFFEQAEK